MIYKNNLETEAAYFGKKVLQAIYAGGVKVWELVSSCYGKGFWINEKPWDNKDAWKNK